MASTTTTPPSHVAIIGAGLVGSLCAGMLASRGWTVDLIESRPDPRLTPPSTRARSINLALSPRGIEALRSVSEELADRVIKEGVPMRGRMLHHRPGKAGGETRKEGQDYGIEKDGEVIRSISRGVLGVYLLDHLDTLGSVKTHFGTKLVDMDMRREQGTSVTIKNREKGEWTLEVDLVVGGDGAYSQVRRQMMRGTRFDYKQTYARHSYLELSIPAGPNTTWSIEPNFLHIWPRGEFMLIALPNQDKSFTLTLFAYQSTFEDIEVKLEKNSSVNPVINLFKTEFPDALELMGEEALMTSWRDNPKDGLITIECSPYHYLDKALLIGDAAHAMVPFYGQGMNCGFEDVRVLSTILDHFTASPSPSPLPTSPLPFSAVSPSLSSFPTSIPGQTSLALALQAYTTLRAPSVLAIQQLAAANYAEMASSVLSPLYLLRLSLDTVLARVFVLFGKKEGGGRGGGWESLYRMVTFRYGIAYEEALRRRAWQGKVLEVGLGVVGVGLGTAVAGIAWAGRRRWPGRH